MSDVSVIVPVYKVEPYLRRCVDSILTQTFTDFELILVDDGSPDNCPAICDEYSRKDSRVHVIHQPNGGLSAARNAGIGWALANSNSQWLTFVDSDDWIHPQMLEVLYCAAVCQNTAVAMCRLEKTAENAQNVQQIPAAIFMKPEDAWMTESAPMVAVGKLYKKHCFEGVCYPVGKIHEDEFITHRILFAQSAVSLVPAVLYHYFDNPDGIMRAQWSMKRLNALEAYAEQVVYFRDNGFERAYQRARTNHIICMANSLQALQQQSSKDALVIQKSLQKTLRRAMHGYHWELKISGDTREWLWGLCYPRLIRARSIFRRIFSHKQK